MTQSGIAPSKYQSAIIEWLVMEEGNAIISARAGAGKTSTLVMLADQIATTGTRAVFLAFNKSIATELKSRLPRHVEAATFHSVCFRALARTIPESRNRDWVDAQKMQRIIDTMTATDERVNEVRSGLIRLIGLMKANMLTPESSNEELVSVIELHEIDFQVDDPKWITPLDILNFARQALALSNEETAHIDFDDMLYLTAIRNVPLMRYSHVFIDEAQDTNKVQRALLERMLGRSGRLIAVGDAAQSIYGFRGADSEAMNLIANEFNCKTFPLSISYRCPASVVRLAQKIVPEIEARENAPEGTVDEPDKWSLAQFDATDLVVCRNTAPVVALAFRFIRAHMPVRVLGRDIGSGLISLIKKMRVSTLEELDTKVQEWSIREQAKANAKRLESKAQRIQDQADTIIAMCEGMPENERTVSALVMRITDLFSDRTDAQRTTLATIHKAKGMEAHRVIILDSFLMPSKYAKLPWQQIQERNLSYVAVTRSLDTLLFIDSEAIS